MNLLSTFPVINTRRVTAVVFAALVINLGLMPPVSGDESMTKAMESFEAGDYQQALEIWLLKAYEGDAEAQYRLGRMFLEGIGTVVDLSESVYWFTRASEQGHTEAQYELGNAWFHGSGVSPDKAKAMEWWHVAAENGSANAQYHLGRAYFYGIDLEQNSGLAVEWFTKAAENGNKLSATFLQRIGIQEGENDTGEVGWKGFGRIGDRAIWVYSSFNRLSPILTKLRPESLVRITEQRSGWFRVQLPGGVPVWVLKDNVEHKADSYQISGAGVHAWPDPDSDASVKPVGMFVAGDRIVPIDEKNAWVRVQAPESITAWVEAIDVDEAAGDKEDLEREWASAHDAALSSFDSGKRITVVLPAAPGSDRKSVYEVDGVRKGNTVESSGVAEGMPKSMPEPDTASEGIAEEVVSSEPATDQTGSADSLALDAANSGTHEEEIVASGTNAAPVSSVDPKSTAQEEAAPGVSEPSAYQFGVPADQGEFVKGGYLRVGPQGQSIYALNRLSSARIDLMPAGMLVKVVERKEDWVQVEVPGGLPLWIFSRFIERDGENGRITGKGVRARPLPSTSSGSQPVGVYPFGAEVRVISESNQWVRVRAPESIAGWLQIDELFLVTEDDDILASEWLLQRNSGIPLKQDSDQDSQGEDVVIAEVGAETDARDANESSGVVPQDTNAGTDQAVRESVASDTAAARASSAQEEEPQSAEVARVDSAVESETMEESKSNQEAPKDQPGQIAESEDVVGAGVDLKTETSTTASSEESILESVEAETPVKSTPESAHVEVVIVDQPSGAPSGENSTVTEAENSRPETSLEAETVNAPGESESGLAESVETGAEASVVETELADTVPSPAEVAHDETVVEAESSGTLEKTSDSRSLEEEAVDAQVLATDPAAGMESEELLVAVVESPGMSTASGQDENSTDLKLDTSDKPDPQEAMVSNDIEPGSLPETQAGVVVPTESMDAPNAESSDELPSKTSLAPEGEAVADAILADDSANGDSQPGPESESESVEVAQQNVGSDASPTRADSASVADSHTSQASDAAGDDARGVVHYDDLVWLYGHSRESFSIELLRGQTREVVAAAARRVKNVDAVYSFSSREGDRLIYNLMVGGFKDLLEVKKALGDLPAEFEGIRIRRLGPVQQQWCGQIDNLTPDQLLVVLDKCAH